MKNNLLYIILCLLITGKAIGQEKGSPNFVLSSPNGLLEFRFNQIGGADKKELTYEVYYDKIRMIESSRLGLEMDNRTWENAMSYSSRVEKVKSWNDNLVFDRLEYKEKDTTWRPLYGERSEIHDNYKSATVYFVKNDNSNYKMEIEVRAYNEGIAFRYRYPMHPDAIYNKIVKDLTEYTLPQGAETWVTEWAQGEYHKIGLDEWVPGIDYERPLTIQLQNGTWLSLTDAKVDNWPMTTFIKSEDKEQTISTHLYETVDMVTPYHTPWKIIMVAPSAGKLLENNDIVLNLSDSIAITDTDWIKPGKIMRETTLTTENAFATIDFCAERNMQYILFDWTWYGPAFDYDSDATEVVKPIDMEKVIAYGKEKGIGVWVYVNHHALERQAKEVFPLLKKWGIAGVKFGFVQFKTHRWATWVHDMIRLAAEHELMVNIHDEFRPSGFSRTYPNLLTQEGIRGNEEFPDATHNTVLPFTRMISGAGDYTVCYFDPRIKNTHAHQLAFPVIYYSPLQTLYWYDTVDRVEEVPELEFFDKVPVVFDDTKVIHDKIGEYVTIARRKGEEWFIGTIGNNDAQDVSVPFDFLENEKTYLAHIYVDDDTVDTGTKVGVSKVEVNSTTVKKFRLKPSGGIAIHVYPN